MAQGYTFDVDTLLNEAMRAMNGQTAWAPACNTFEDQRGYWIQAALPGVDRADIEIVAEDGVLTIKGVRKADQNESRKYFVRDIHTGPFSRSFRLPDTVDQDRVGATYKDGVLTVELPKREELKPRRIIIQ